MTNNNDVIFPDDDHISTITIKAPSTIKLCPYEFNIIKLRMMTNYILKFKFPCTYIIIIIFKLNLNQILNSYNYFLFLVLRLKFLKLPEWNKIKLYSKYIR